MNRKTYYISVQSGEILQEKGDSAFEFEIEATPSEIQFLEELFTKLNSENLETFYGAHFPFKSDEIAQDHIQYDEALEEVYRQLYKLGKKKTKEVIEKLGIINLH